MNHKIYTENTKFSSWFSWPSWLTQVISELERTRLDAERAVGLPRAVRAVAILAQLVEAAEDVLTASQLPAAAARSIEAAWARAVTTFVIKTSFWLPMR